MAFRKPKKKGAIQVFNPETKRWVKIDIETGNIIGRKKSKGAYKNIPKGKGAHYSNYA